VSDINVEFASFECFRPATVDGLKPFNVLGKQCSYALSCGVYLVQPGEALHGSIGRSM
jgi:hypothetical protein